MIIKKQIINLLAGAATFAFVTTLLQYLTTNKLSFAGLVGGISWFVVGYILTHLKNKEINR